jgi:GNAT superfamily N-acetyltransferase
MNADASETRLRQMERADIPEGLRLCAQAGWNQTETDWKRLLDWEPDGCFVLESASGSVSATVTTTVYEELLAWVGMMLVDTACRRRGYARTLLSHALDYLEQARGVQTIALDATPLGMPLYESLGFVAAYTLTRYEGRIVGANIPADVSRVQADDVPKISALDRDAFGADRRRLLQSLFQDEATIGYWLPGAAEGGVRGYVYARPGARTGYVGPLVAMDSEVAEGLLRAALHPLSGEAVAIDIPDENAAARNLVERVGLQPVRSFTRMVRGAGLPTAKREHYFAIAGPEIG